MNSTFKSFQTHTDLTKDPIKQPSLYQIKLYNNNYQAADLVQHKIMKKTKLHIKNIKTFIPARTRHVALPYTSFKLVTRLYLCLLPQNSKLSYNKLYSKWSNCKLLSIFNKCTKQPPPQNSMD